MARTGHLVMHGDRDGEYDMFIDLAGIDFPPHKLRKFGYFSHPAILVGRSAASDPQPTTGVLPVEVEGNALLGNTHIGTSPVLESQSSTASLKEVGDEEFGSQQAPEEETRKFQHPDTQVTTMDGSEDDAPGMSPPSQQDPDTQATLDGSKDDVPGTSRQDLDPQATLDGFEDDVPGISPQPLLGMHKQKKPVRVLGRVPRGLAPDDFSEEEDEDPISEIDEYDILDEENELVSLFELPLHHHENNNIVNVGCSTQKRLHVRGKHGVFEYMRQITAWKLVFIPDHPIHLQVKIDEFHWVKLRTPSASYKRISESVYFVVKFLDIVKKDPTATAKAVWKLLLERDIDDKTVLEYLKKQSQLIEQYIALDPILTSANVLETYQALLSRKAVNPQKRRRSDEEEDNDVFDQWRAKKKEARIATGNEKSSKLKETLEMEETRFQHAEDDVSMSETEEEVEEEIDEDDEELGDPLCTICDDGGDLLCCEGPCMRSFHAHPEAGVDSKCKSLGFTKAALEKMEKYLCKNCKYKKHQCYVCGKLGTSDETLGVEREVFVCEVALCGKFYHPHCIAKEIASSKGDERPLAKRIQSGEETFTCPMHTCKKCGKCEDKEDETEELRLAKCRRCPATWHVKCLPKEIAFDDKCQPQRAWRVGQRPRFIIYCMKHALDRKLQTPTRDHLLEPSTPEQRREPHTKNILNSQSKRTAQVRGIAGTSGAPRAKSRVANQYGSGQSGFLDKEKSQEENEARENISMNRRILDVIRIAAERKPDEKIRSALLCKVPKSYKDKTFKEKDFISDGKLSSMLKAARNALAKFQKSHRIDDAHMICPPSDVSGIINAERMFKSFLAPTLFGNRYTSFGRHFTKDEKLQEVANRLHGYIEDGDMLVDFCCGSNDFSIKMHEILTRTGKRNCRYKNFDILKPKNTFHFEQKDWLTVKKDDLGPCQDLVIGLNPPFADAKKFVTHALYSEPKLLVLIIPEDQGLIRNIEFKYECLLDDNQLLAGKAFYLPGSVHTTDTEMLEQGNHIAPHLYIFRKRLKHNKGMPLPRADCRVEELEVPTHLERRPLNASDSVRSQRPAVGLDSLFIPNRRNPKINKYQNPRAFAVPATNRHAADNIYNAPRSSGPPGFGGRPLSQSHHPKFAPHSDPPPQPHGVHQNVAGTSGRDPPQTSQSQHGVAPYPQFASSSRHHPTIPTSDWDSAVRAHTVPSSHNTTLPPCEDMYGNNNNHGVQHRLPPLPPALPESVLHERSSAFPTSLPSYVPPPIQQGIQINRYLDCDPRTSQSQYGVAPYPQSASSSRHHPMISTSGWDSAARAHTVHSSHNTTLPPCDDMYGNNNHGVQHRLPPLPPALPESVLRERSSAFPTSLPSYVPPPIQQGIQINSYPDRDPRRQFHQAPQQQSPSPPPPGEDYHEGGGWLED